MNLKFMIPFNCSTSELQTLVCRVRSYLTGNYNTGSYICDALRYQCNDHIKELLKKEVLLFLV